MRCHVNWTMVPNVAECCLVASSANKIMAPVVLFTFLIQKYLMTGLGGDAVRG